MTLIQPRFMGTLRLFLEIIGGVRLYPSLGGKSIPPLCRARWLLGF